MNDVDARMDRLRRAARYRYQQLVDSEVERGSLDPDEVREERRLLRAQDVGQHARMLVEQAERRGVFDGNPYHGKPLPGNDGRHDPDWWIKAKIEREDIRGIAPPAFALRTEDAELDGHLDALATEDDVRAVLVDFNARVKEARRQLLGGPPVVTPMRDVDAEVEAWAARRRDRLAAAAEVGGA
ncbi:DnaJ family domain-containing protein, partial [Curtobacterium albidum]|uniref:DnaJ family domain-containing protein n=1 Tax=Curtobacterium citreum TaxID=2036 RepID=UPI0035EFF5E5